MKDGEHVRDRAVVRNWCEAPVDTSALKMLIPVVQMRELKIKDTSHHSERIEAG